MQFVENLGGYFLDFGEVAIWKSKVSINIIFDNEYILSNGLVDSLNPAILVQASEVVGIAKDQTIKIKNDDYLVKVIEPDVNGAILFVKLEKQ